MAPPVLKKAFFERPVLEVSRDLLGKQLVRVNEDGVRRLIITEVEAYDGEKDKACHASRGRTPRTDVMYGPAGYWYVYIVYGMHAMLNIVTGDREYPAAVLLRAAGSISGPGRLTRALSVRKDEHNAAPAKPKTGLWIEDGEAVPDVHVKRAPRIGVEYAGDWARVPYRFIYTPETE